MPNRRLGIPDRLQSWPRHSSETYLSAAKINIQALFANEIQAEQSVNIRARRQSVTQNIKVSALLPQCNEFVCLDHRREFYSAPGRYLHAVLGKSRIVSDRD